MTKQQTIDKYLPLFSADTRISYHNSVMTHGEVADVADLGRAVQVILADGTRELFFKKYQKPPKIA